MMLICFYGVWFPSTSEVKKNLDPYELHEEATQSLSKGSELQTQLEVTKDGESDLLPSGSVLVDENVVGIWLLKARHDVTKLNLTIPLLSLWCIDINLSIQPLFLTLNMTWVHWDLHKKYKSWAPISR